jgi:glycerol-3-phosphate dehydrogenase
MGPCQGAFCTFRAAGVVAERGVAATRPAEPTRALPAAEVDGVLLDFLAERYRGTKPIAWGRQLQELWITAGLYRGVLGVDSLLGATPVAETGPDAGQAPPATAGTATAEGSLVHADR